MKRDASLAKLSTLFAMMERVHTLQLAQAHRAASDAEGRLYEHVDRGRQLHVARRLALTAADADERHLLDTAQQAALRQLPLLQAQQAHALRARDAASMTQRESRFERDRIQAVLERVRVAARVVDERRAQAAIDDRFAARQAWQQAREDAE